MFFGILSLELRVNPVCILSIKLTARRLPLIRHCISLTLTAYLI